MIIICMILAVVPSLLLVMVLERLDEGWDNDRSIVIKLMLGGMLSVMFAAAAEELGDELLLEMGFSGNWYSFLDNFLVTAVTEEIIKFLVMMIVAGGLLSQLEEYRIIKYMILAGSGFALAENLVYCMDGDLLVAGMRAVMCIPGHAMYGLFMGHEMVKMFRAADQGRYLDMFKSSIGMLLIPILHHGIYDFSIDLENDWVILFTLVYNVVLYKVSIDMLKKAAKEQIQEPCMAAQIDAAPVWAGTI